MANTLKLEIIVDDKGTPIVQKFADGTTAALNKVEAAGGQMGGGFEKSWAGMATGANQAIQVLHEVAAAAGQVWDLARIGAEYAEQSGILENLSSAYETNSKAIMESMAAASGGLIANADLMKTALAGVAKGLTPDQLKELANAATILGDVVGKDATTALNDLTSALVSGRTKGLKEYLGTTIDLDTAFGGLDEKMTAAEKTQALYNITMLGSISLQGQQKKAVDETADKMDKVEASYKNAKLAVADWAKAVVGGAYDVVMAAKPYLTNTNEQNAALIAAGKSAAEYTNALVGEREATTALLAPYKAQIDALKGMLGTRKGDEQAVKEHAAAAKKAAEEAIKNSIDGAELVSKLSLERIKRDEEDLKFFEKMETDKIKALEKEADAWRKAGDDALDAMMKEIEQGVKMSKDTLDRLDKRRMSEREILKDLRGESEQYYAAVNELNQSQYDKYIDLGVKKGIADAWLTDQMEQNLIKQGKDSDSFFDGFNAGLIEMGRNAMTFGTAGYEIFKTMAGNSQKAMSDILFQGIKTGTIDAEAIWGTFSDNMLRKLTDTVSQMVTEAAAKDIAMAFKAEWTPGSSEIVGLARGLYKWATGSSSVPSATDTDMFSGAMDADFLASGGPMQAGKPTWVGEKGPELLFPSGSGYVMNNRDSMAYAAQNSGFIPGLAEGGTLPGGIQSWIAAGSPDFLTRGNARDEALLAELAKNSMAPLWLNPAIEGGVLTGGKLNPDYEKAGWFRQGEHWRKPFLESGFRGDELGYLVSLIHGADIGESLNRESGGFGGLLDSIWNEGLGKIAAEVGRAVDKNPFIVPLAFIAWASALAPAAGGSTAGGGFTAAGAGTTSSGAMVYGSEEMLAAGAELGLTSTETLSLTNAALGGTSALEAYFTEAGLAYAKETAIKELLKRGAAYLLNGSGGLLSIDFAGMNDGGLFSSLSGIMGNIAPKEDILSFPMVSARNGLDYVPRDNFWINTHEGEAVLTRRDADDWRSGRTDSGSGPRMMQPIILQIDRRTIATLLLDMSRDGVKVIHQRGVADH